MKLSEIYMINKDKNFKNENRKRNSKSKTKNEFDDLFSNLKMKIENEKEN